MIVTHHKYQVGDIIQISGDVSAFGTIIEVGTRFTVIQGYDLQRIMIPNLTMIRNPIITFSAESMIRCTTTLTLPRSTNISKVRPLLTDVVNRHTATTANEYTTVLIS
jgi:small-conductance mechanosensitive channel